MSNFPISAWAIRNPIPVTILFIALVLAGIGAYRSLAVKQWPDLTFPIVIVTVVQQGAAPEELNTQVARLVENAVSSVPGVDAVRSTVVQGVSTTTVEFEIGEDPMEKTDDVQTAIDGIRADLPRQAEEPIVSRLNVDSAPILTYAVAAPGMSDTDLSWFVEDTLARRLQSIGGVAQVSRVGGVDREINVVVDPARMSALDVTASQINDALRSFTVDTSGGRAQIGGREQTVRILGQAETVAALRNTTIPTGRGYVRLADVAEVGGGPAEERGFARLNGRPVVAFQVNKTQEASDVDVEDKVIVAVEALRKEFPNVQITPIISIVEETRKNFEATEHVLIEGILLAALVVFVFLRDWRATLITTLAMPLSLIPTFFALQLLGFSLNIVTLLALTLVIGILVDDAIVEIENIQKRVERGETPYRAALVGADQIGLAVVATTAAIVVVFTPVSFMPGIPGQYFKSFGLTVAVSVIFSLLVARLITPLMAAYFLKPATKVHVEPPMPVFYRKTLNWTLDHKWWSLVFGLAFFVISMVVFVRFLPKGFIPTEDPGYYYLSLEGPPGAAREDMERTVQDTTRRLLSRPEVDRVFAQVGSTAGGDPFSGGGGGDLRSGTFTVVLKEKRAVDTEGSKEAVRPLLREIPDARIATLGGFGSADIEIILASENGQLLERTALQLQREMRTLNTLIADVRPATPPPGPELIIRPTEEAARLGVSSEAMAAVIRVATVGEIDAAAPKFSEGERQLQIRVRLPETARSDLETISNLEVPVAGGGTARLSSVADITFAAGAGRITRFDRERNLTIQADLKPGVVLGTAETAISKLGVMQNLPQGVRRAQYGNSEAQAELFGGFLGAMGAGVFLIFGVMVLLFRSFFKPVIILFALPLAAGGAFFALLFTGLDVTMPVLIGLLMLLGLAAKNSILLVELAIELERAGANRHDAIWEACRERWRPIVMTSLAMSAGMLPTALALGAGAEFRQPMAIAVIGGLFTSTVLSLVLIPAAYVLVDSLEQWLTPKLGRLTTPRGEPVRGEPGARHPAE